MRLRFGIVAAQGRPFAELLDHWLKIENLGFDNAWLIDHFAPPFRPDGAWLESWTTLPELGIGAGYYEEEQRMLRIDYPDAK